MRDAFAPVPVLRAPYFPEEVVGPEMLDRLGDALYADAEPAAVLHERLAHELIVTERRATVRLDLPFASKGDISLRKIGAEVIVRVDSHKRTLLLPPALADYRPAGASFVDGALELTFDAADA